MIIIFSSFKSSLLSICAAYFFLDKLQCLVLERRIQTEELTTYTMEQVPVEMESSDSSDNVLNPNKINEETANIVDESDCKLPFASQLVSPRTITGSANVLNKGAIDWYVY